VGRFMMTAAMAPVRVMMKMDRKRMISHKTRRRLLWLVLPGADGGVDGGLVGLSSVQGRRVYFRGWRGFDIFVDEEQSICGEQDKLFALSQKRDGEAQGRRWEMRA
jgi:hypothetical protein